MILKFIKSFTLTIAVLVVLIVIFLFTRGYNFEYIKLAFGRSCFLVNEYRFCPSNKFNVIFIYNGSKRVAYVNGYVPLFNENDPSDYVMLQGPGKNNLITIFLNEISNPDTKDTCLKYKRCLYREMIMFGQSAYSVMPVKLPEQQFIHIPKLKIVISSNLIDDKILNEIDISKYIMAPEI